MVNVGVEHGSTARGTVYERAVDLARMGDTWLENGLAKGSRVGLACWTWLACGIFASCDYAPGAGAGCDLGDVRVPLSLSLRARTRCRVR